MKLLFLSCIVGGCLAATSCSSENETFAEGSKNTVHFAVIANAGFSANTRAVNESSYADATNYTVQILNSTGKVLLEYPYNEVPANLELNNGSYTLKAFHGEDTHASRNSFYVEGSNSFKVEGKEQSVIVNCYPVCGKVTVRFAENMSSFFSDYSIVYETEALNTNGSTATWSRTDTEPWYLKVKQAGESVKATICVTRLSDNKSSSTERIYNLLPNKSWTLNIAPEDKNGSLGLSIEIEESTNDHQVDIVVPSDWI